MATLDRVTRGERDIPRIMASLLSTMSVALELLPASANQRRTLPCTGSRTTGRVRLRATVGELRADSDFLGARHFRCRGVAPSRSERREVAESLASAATFCAPALRAGLRELGAVDERVLHVLEGEKMTDWR